MLSSYHSDLPFTLEPFSPSPTLFISQEPSAGDLLFTDHLPITPPPVTIPPPPSPPRMKNATSSGTSVRKRATRKDRHSKIVTAQGPRDRRLRLNLEVAPLFFGIQDMLGFDKGSKTVKWLMNEAKASIEKLKVSTRGGGGGGGGNSSKSTTEVSSSELECDQDISTVTTDYKGKSPDIAPKAKKVARSRLPSRSTRASQYSPSLAREIRDKARERARERTRVKMNKNNMTGMDHQKSGSHELKSSLDVVAEVEEQCSPSITQLISTVNNGGGVDELSVSILDYNNNNTMTTNNLFREYWVSQFDNIEDVQLLARLWYA